MNRVYIRSCEAEYLGALVGTSDFCKPPRQPPVTRNNAPENGAGANEGGTAGSLVIHIRSGDIFRFKRDKKVRTLFGQVGGAGEGIDGPLMRTWVWITGDELPTRCGAANCG